MQPTFRRAITLFVLALSLMAVARTADIVYLSKTGKKYHRKTCRTLIYEPRPIERKAAEAAGYAACRICKP